MDAFGSTLNANFNEHTCRYANYANAHLIPGDLPPRGINLVDNNVVYRAPVLCGRKVKEGLLNSFNVPSSTVVERWRCLHSGDGLEDYFHKTIVW